MAFKELSPAGKCPRPFATVIERLLITSTNTVLLALTTGADVLTQTFETVERSHILHILKWHPRVRGGAAQILGLKAKYDDVSQCKSSGSSWHK